jgi:hypothetical protein
VRAASLPRLVEQLTYEKYSDPAFVATELLTYLTFTTEEELLRLLIARFEGADAEHSADALVRIRFRVAAVLRQWLVGYPQDFAGPLGATLVAFVEGPMTNTAPKLAAPVRLAYSRLTTAVSKPPLSPQAPPPRPLLPRVVKGRAVLELSDIKPLELARQLTLIDHASFASLRPRECIGCHWTKVPMLSALCCAAELPCSPRPGAWRPLLWR